MPKVITFGEIMLRLSTPGYLRFSQAKQFEATFGGGEANVAVSLANYGIEAEFVTRFPKNDIAASCIKDLHSYGVGTKHCIFGGDRPTHPPDPWPGFRSQDCNVHTQACAHGAPTACSMAWSTVPRSRAAWRNSHPLPGCIWDSLVPSRQFVYV